MDTYEDTEKRKAFEDRSKAFGIIGGAEEDRTLDLMTARRQDNSMISASYKNDGCKKRKNVTSGDGRMQPIRDCFCTVTKCSGLRILKDALS